jgi:xylulokinase
MSLIGLDIGTTGCKAIVFREDGDMLGRASREYPVLSPHPDWAEQDAGRVWRLALESLREAIVAARVVAPNDPPVALALSVQGEAVMPVDAQGRPLRAAILGMDTRTVQENAWLAERFGVEPLFRRTGMPLHTVNTLPKLLWLQRHEPDLWKGAHRFLLYEDYALGRLGNCATISHCLASRTQMYDLGEGRRADDILEGCGIDPARLAPLAPPQGGAVGEMSPDVAHEVGLSRPVALVSGGHDQACAALGSGVTIPGAAMVSTGTAEVVEVAMATPALTDELRRGNTSVYRHVVPGLYLAMTLNHSGGLALRWFRDTMCAGEMRVAESLEQDAYDLILADAPDGPTDLLVLPHLAGSGTPWFDTRSRGAVLGLSFATTRSALAKAILEGLTFELRVNLDLLRKSGIAIDVLNAVGGGAKSPLWLQLKADICRLPLRVPQVTEAACLGAALLAGVGAGIYPDPATAVERVVRAGRSIAPDPASSAVYDARYALYRHVYPAVKPFHDALTRG